VAIAFAGGTQARVVSRRQIKYRYGGLNTPEERPLGVIAVSLLNIPLGKRQIITFNGPISRNSY